MKSLVLVVLSSMLLFNCSSNNEKIDKPVIDISGVWKEIQYQEPKNPAVFESEYNSEIHYALIINNNKVEIINPTLGHRENHKIVSIDIINTSEMDITWDVPTVTSSIQVIRSKYELKEGKLVINSFFYWNDYGNIIHLPFPNNLISSKFVKENP